MIGSFDYCLQCLAWSLRTTIPASIPYAPGSLAYQYDMIMQKRIEVDWDLIKRTRRSNMLKNNVKENKDRIEYNYKVGDEVWIIKKGSDIQ